MRDVPWRLVALVAGLFVLGLVLYGSLGIGTGSPPPSTDSADLVGSVDDVEPADHGRDPRSAASQVRRDTCRAACIGTSRTCRGMAAEEPAELSACATALSSCERVCD